MCLASLIGAGLEAASETRCRPDSRIAQGWAISSTVCSAGHAAGAGLSGMHSAGSGRCGRLQRAKQLKGRLGLSQWQVGWV